MILDELNARAALEAAHVALGSGNIASMLSHCDDDIIYWCNAGGLRAKPLRVVSKLALSDYLESVAWVAESISVVDRFQFRDGVGHAKVSGIVRHRRSGVTLFSSFRQVVTFRNRKIVRLDEYHDAARVVAFWRLVASEASDIEAASLSCG